MTPGLINLFLDAEARGCVNRLGSGQGRIAYAVPGLDGAVFKRLKRSDATDNKQEFEFWNAAPDDVREHLAPVLDYDAKAGVLAMVRAKTSGYVDWSRYRHILEAPWSSDVHDGNVGELNGRYVLIDYGHCKVDSLRSTRPGFAREQRIEPRLEPNALCECGVPGCEVFARKRAPREMRWIVDPKDVDVAVNGAIDKKRLEQFNAMRELVMKPMDMKFIAFDFNKEFEPWPAPEWRRPVRVLSKHGEEVKPPKGAMGAKRKPAHAHLIEEAQRKWKK